MPDQGPRRSARLLRLPGRALEAHQDQQPDRKHLRHRPPPNHQLMLSAKKKWRKLDAQNRLPEIIQGVEFRDRIKHEIKAA